MHRDRYLIPRRQEAARTNSFCAPSKQSGSADTKSKPCAVGFLEQRDQRIGGDVASDQLSRVPTDVWRCIHLQHQWPCASRQEESPLEYPVAACVALQHPSV